MSKKGGDRAVAEAGPSEAPADANNNRVDNGNVVDVVTGNTTEIVPNNDATVPNRSRRLAPDVRRVISLDDAGEDWTEGGPVGNIESLNKVGDVGSSRNQEIVVSWRIGIPNNDGARLVTDGLSFDWETSARIGFDADEILRNAPRYTNDYMMLERCSASDPWELNSRSRYCSTFRNRFQIPPGIKSDRVFLFDGSDARYVDETFRFLNDGWGDVPPYSRLASNWSVSALPSGKGSTEKASLSLSGIHGRVLPFDDIVVTRAVDVNPLRVNTSTRLIVPYKEFASLPNLMIAAPWPPGLVMNLPRVVRYFARFASSLDEEGLKRYRRTVVFEYVVDLICALYREIRGAGRVWNIEDATLGFLEKWAGKNKFPKISVSDGRDNEVVDSELTLRLLNQARSQPPAWKVFRNDFPTRAEVSFCVVDNAYRFVYPNRRYNREVESFAPSNRDIESPRTKVEKASEPVVDSSIPYGRSQVQVVSGRINYESIMDDAVVRAYEGMNDVLANESERRAGWMVGEVIDSVHRYYENRIEELNGRISRRDGEIASLRSQLQEKHPDPYRSLYSTQDPYRSRAANVGVPQGNRIDPYAALTYRNQAGGSSTMAYQPINFDPYAPAPGNVTNRVDAPIRSPKRARFNAPTDNRNRGGNQEPEYPHGYSHSSPSYYYPSNSGPGNA